MMTTQYLMSLSSAAFCSGLNEHSNFERFWTAALTLFKIATNDNWTDIMIACMVAVSMDTWIFIRYLTAVLLHHCLDVAQHTLTYVVML